jgi:hypothetical protein
MRPISSAILVLAVFVAAGVFSAWVFRLERPLVLIPSSAAVGAVFAIIAYRRAREKQAEIR